jgi:hypothetical protein
MAAFREVGHWKSRKDEAQRMLDIAAYRAREIQRPLAIVGAVDAPPPGVTVFSPEDPTAIPAQDNSCVVLCSFSLERVDDIDTAWREISRVAGSPFNIFVAHVRGGFASWSPSVRYNIEMAPPLSPILKYKNRYIAYPK